MLITGSSVLEKHEGIVHHDVLDDPFVMVFPTTWRGSVDTLDTAEPLPFVRYSLDTRHGATHRKPARPVHAAAPAPRDRGRYRAAAAQCRWWRWGLAGGASPRCCALRPGPCAHPAACASSLRRAARFARRIQVVSRTGELGDLAGETAALAAEQIRDESLPPVLGQLPLGRRPAGTRCITSHDGARLFLMDCRARPIRALELAELRRHRVISAEGPAQFCGGTHEPHDFTDHAHRRQVWNWYYPGGKPAYFNHYWLRDNCPTSFDSQTRERVFDIFHLETPPRPRSAQIVGDALEIVWDGETTPASMRLIGWQPMPQASAGLILQTLRAVPGMPIITLISRAFHKRISRLTKPKSRPGSRR